MLFQTWPIIETLTQISKYAKIGVFYHTPQALYILRVSFTTANDLEQSLYLLSPRHLTLHKRIRTKNDCFPITIIFAPAWWGIYFLKMITVDILEQLN